MSKKNIKTGASYYLSGKNLNLILNTVKARIRYLTYELKGINKVEDPRLADMRRVIFQNEIKDLVELVRTLIDEQEKL